MRKFNQVRYLQIYMHGDFKTSENGKQSVDFMTPMS